MPVFARNRWLEANDYRPPLIDNYWRQAARYWLIHLTRVSDLLQPKNEHELFKRCVLEMGLQGLKSVFELLKDDVEREYFENLYGKNRPAFYAACLPTQYDEYLDTLLDHLQKQAYFPFGELGIGFQPKHNDKLVSIINELNNLKQFERITFTDCLKNPTDCKGFLQKLMEKARKKQWVGLIVIPELEDKTNTNEAVRELRVMYALLNDIILKNRHQKAADELIKHIEEVSNFAMPGTTGTTGTTGGKATAKKEQAVEDLDKLIDLKFKNLAQPGPWPLKKGGVVQLQLQQQQQIEQSRQMQQEQQKMVVNMLEQAITSELVDYTNIDRLLKKFWDDFGKENPVKPAAATLKTDTETLLQGFFHTWINAKPGVQAHHVIKQMTLEAAQALLRKHSRLPSGLNPENLPKGFYTQRSKDGHLILCYSPELSYVSPPNALTLDLTITIPQGEAWEGDFRQFDLDAYVVKGVADFDKEDWNNIILFARMQPPKKSYKEDYDEFISNNAALNLGAHKDKIIKHWPIFLQAWQYAGEAGVKAFIKKPETDLTLSNKALKTLLLSKLKSTELEQWAATLNMDDAYLRALGQIYYRYGNRGMITFLRKLNQLDAVLGEDFFDHFNQHVIAKSANFNCFMNENFFLTLDDMMEKLKPTEAQDKLNVWKKIMQLHMDSMDWEKIETLWRGFSYFSSEIEQMGLKFEGDEFDKIKPENMLVCMDRILNSLNQIPDFDMQKLFLSGLERFDLTYGGVHYALQHEGFKYFDKELKLHDFDSGSPTYAPDLASLYKWRKDDAELKMKRTLASKAQFSQQAYKLLVDKDKLGNDKLESRDKLLWLLHTQYSAVDMGKVLDKLESIAPAFEEMIAKHLFTAVYERGNKQLNISLNAVIKLLAPPLNIKSIFTKYPDATALEAASILYLSKRRDEDDVNQLIALLNAPMTKPKDYPDYLFREGYKLATLFGVTNPSELEKFYKATADIRPIVHNELKLLINQILSIDYTNSDLDALIDSDHWQALLDCIEAMKGDMAHTADHRIALMEQYTTKNLQFKYSKSGEFRAITNTVEDKPSELGFFVDHEDRLWEFLQKHILVPTKSDAKEAQKPIIRFLKKLQLNRTYLNEIEPLLSSLEKMPEGHYWSSTYFFQMLRALQPENDQALFPISLLKVMLEEDTIAPKKIDDVEKDFPVELTEPLQAILKNTVFDRNQQGILCQIALREYSWQGNVALLNQIMAILSIEGYAASRTYALEILANSKNFPELESRFENCRWLLQHPPAPEINSQWSQTTALWLKAISLRKKEEDLFNQIKTQFAADPNKLSLILHVVAFSTLRPGLKDSENYQYDLNKKAAKLIDRLASMNNEDLVQLAQTYPNQPSPSTDDIIRLLKKQEKEAISWEASYETFACQPFTEPRTDYGLYP